MRLSVRAVAALVTAVTAVLVSKPQWLRAATNSAGVEDVDGWQPAVLSRAVVARTPAVFRGAAHAWWHRGVLNASSVAALLPAGQPVTVEQSTSPRFMYFDADAPGLLPDTPAEQSGLPPSQPAHMMPAALLAATQRPTPPVHTYLTTPLSGAALAALWTPDAVAAMTVHDDGAGGHADDDAAVVPSLWWGSAGVITHLHYDAPHNVFAQLVGAKRFVLMPPAAAAAARLFPHLHPRTRKSQLRVGMALSNVPAALRGDAAVVDLAPGDVLYLPPYWLHQVRSDSAPTMSVNAFSPSRELEAASAALGAALPFTAAWLHAPDTATAAVARWLNAVIAGAGFPPRRFLHDLLHQRYGWRGALPAHPNPTNTGRCAHPDVSAADFRGHVAVVTRALARLPAPAPRGTVVGDYVEMCVSSFVGVDQVVDVVVRCWL